METGGKDSRLEIEVQRTSSQNGHGESKVTMSLSPPTPQWQSLSFLGQHTRLC